MSQRYVSRYTVDRRFGGPEEGGWWYDWHTYEGMVAIIPADVDEEEGYAITRALNAAAQAEKAEHGRLNRYSMAGSPDTVYLLEDDLCEHETTVRPHYE